MQVKTPGLETAPLLLGFCTENTEGHTKTLKLVLYLNHQTNCPLIRNHAEVKQDQILWIKDSVDLLKRLWLRTILQFLLFLLQRHQSINT